MLYLTSGTVLTKVSAEPGERTAAVPDGITEIGAYCFAGQNWQKVILPDSVEVIERNAFERCKALRSVRLSEDLYYLGYRAFADCTALETLRTIIALGYRIEKCGAPAADEAEDA